MTYSEAYRSRSKDQTLDTALQGQMTSIQQGRVTATADNAQGPPWAWQLETTTT